MSWSVEDARAAPDLQEWILAYLAVPEWENAGLIRRVRAYGSVWEGPSLVPLAPLVRIAGPGPDHRFPQDPVEWHRQVISIIDRGLDRESVPPLILWQDGAGLQIADGNHRADALARCGHREAWALISPYPLREGAREAWEAEG